MNRIGKDNQEITKYIHRLRELRHQYFPAGSLRNSLVSGAFWSLTGAVSSRGFALIAFILIARILGKAGFGKWGIIITSSSMFAQFASCGVALTATKHVAELRRIDRPRAGRALSLILIVGLVSVSVMSLVCIALSKWLSFSLYKIPELYIPIMLASLIIIGRVGTLMLQGALAGFEDFRSIARTNLIQGIVLFLTAVPLTWKFGLVGAVIGMGVSQCVAMVMCLMLTFKRSRENEIVLSVEGIWKERELLWGYAAPSLLTSLFTGPANVLSQAIVSNVQGGVAGLGGFNAGFKWREVLLFIPAAVRKVTLPMLSKLKGESDYPRFRKALAANIFLNGGITLIGAIPIIILSPWILSFYGADFRNDWDMMIVLVITAVFQSVNDVVAQVTACLERMWWRFAVHVFWGLILLGGSYIFVPIFGVRGYVYSFAAAVVSHMILNSIAAVIATKQINN